MDKSDLICHPEDVMNNCIFCNIAGNPVSEDYRIFYSDTDYYAMLTLTPETPGHFLVIPNKHYSEVSKMKNYEDYFKKAITLAETKIKKINAEAYTIKFNNNVYLLEKGVGHVGHLHIHVIPKYSKKIPKVVKTNRAYFVKMSKLLS